ncbi:MAG: WYL domain-containing protein, partial [Nannocystaceae bacterium]|nr:WYL domain-containing protein [Nannocystaceae bacterium]
MRSRVIRLLQVHPEGLTKAELVAKIGTTPETSQRVLTGLRLDGTLVRDTKSNVWSLVDPGFSEPLDNPQPQDLEAVLLAEALLGPVADSALRERLRRLAEGIDDRLRSEKLPTRKRYPTMAREAVAATLSFSTRIDTKVLSRLLRSVRREVVQLRYYSPWDDVESTRVVAPWQIRLLDGVFYLRCWDLEAKEPRTLRVVHILSVSSIPNAGRPEVPVPRPADL